jgi:hypothetical protein
MTIKDREKVSRNEGFRYICAKADTFCYNNLFNNQKNNEKNFVGFAAVAAHCLR